MVVISWFINQLITGGPHPVLCVKAHKKGPQFTLGPWSAQESPGENLARALGNRSGSLRGDADTNQPGRGKNGGIQWGKMAEQLLGSIFSDINMIYHIVDGFNQLILLLFIFCEIWGWTWTWIGHAFEKIWVEALPTQKLVFNSQELYSVWPTEMGIRLSKMKV